MKKLLKLLDNRLLFYLVAFLLIFIPLYPKLPAVGVSNTWVYIRVEDFVIACAMILFLVQLLRKKVSIYIPLGIPIATYWVVGFFSLIISLIFISPQLTNFFPHVAVLSYLRRVEYMSLFFIGFSVIKNSDDLKKLFWVVCLSSLVTVLYGIGQRYYINLWTAFPSFFEKFPYCFPSFQTTNEEFAKGIPLCLPMDGRITSLFAGHYDLSAYLVLIIPIVFSVIFAVRKTQDKIFLSILGVGLIYLLILTASRISFAAYIIGIIFAFSFIKKKLFLIPILIISIILLSTSSESVLKRFTQTLRFANIVVNNSGDVVGEAVDTLPDTLKDRISKEPIILESLPPTQNLPTGSSYISLPGNYGTTSSAFFQTKAKLSKTEQDKYKFGAVEISNVQGNFLIKRALVYDISFTTRFQGEWPNTWKAYERNPLLGSGYSTITLSSDNSFLRALGETGIFGLLTFFSFFLVWYIFVRGGVSSGKSFEKYFVFGLSAGVIGLSINAILIDVFEASKVAETMWLLLGIGAAGLALSIDYKIDYLKKIKEVISSSFFLMLYLLILFFYLLSSSFDNFFVGDDFTWIRWASDSSFKTLGLNFIDAGGFFLRPIDKLLIFIEYTFFSMNTAAFHTFNLFYNFSTSVCVYFLTLIIFKKKYIAFLGALIFSFIPSHSQNLFWISTISPTVSSAFILAGLISFYYARQLKNIWLVSLSAVLFLLALFSYENAIIFVGLVVLVDLFLIQISFKKKADITSTYYPYVIFVLEIILYLGIRYFANTAGFSGDYNYNLAKILPNAVGNYIGYVSIFFFSENSLATYNLIRQSLKTYYVLISILGVFLLAFVGGFLLEHKEKIRPSKNVKIFVFGLLFSVIALLPYLPLGNIALRYVYLGSFGFIVMVLAILDSIIFSKLHRKSSNFYTFGILYILVGTLCYIGLQRAELHWDRASKITYNTLAHLKLDYDFGHKNTNLYFINLPTKTGEAYIFPVGLSDAIYLIHRNENVKTFIVENENQARSIMKGDKERRINSFLFNFDNNYQIHEVKNQ